MTATATESKYCNYNNIAPEEPIRIIKSSSHQQSGKMRKTHHSLQKRSCRTDMSVISTRWPEKQEIRSPLITHPLSLNDGCQKLKTVQRAMYWASRKASARKVKSNQHSTTSPTNTRPNTTSGINNSNKENNHLALIYSPTNRHKNQSNQSRAQRKPLKRRSKNQALHLEQYNKAGA